jgi:RimJ/RimL family protein N-acetyltransferase
MKITFHKATTDDTSMLVETRILFALELAGAQSPEKVEVLRTEMNRYFAQATAANACISYIARCEAEVAGIGSVHFREVPGNFNNPSGKWGYIMNMYTLPAYRKNGICREILRLLMEDGKQLGITSFELHATPHGEPIYQQAGFEMHKEPTYRKYISLSGT